jgi:Receptor L domain
MKRLEGCKYIDGAVTLSWLKDAHGFSIRNFSFPDLVEIRDFLKMHHVDNLLSVGDLFPNLAVIRGDQLNNQYSLQIAENKMLERVGLANLRYIGKGNIQVKNNQNACFVDTINWPAIAPNTNSEFNNIDASSLLRFIYYEINSLIHNQFRLIVRTVPAVTRASIIAGTWKPHRELVDHHVKQVFVAPMALAAMQNVSVDAPRRTNALHAEISLLVALA